MNHIMHMPPEDDEGHTEYKYQLIGLTNNQQLHLASQLTYRLHGGDSPQGQAIYMTLD